MSDVSSRLQTSMLRCRRWRISPHVTVGKPATAVHRENPIRMSGLPYSRPQGTEGGLPTLTGNVRRRKLDENGTGLEEGRLCILRMSLQHIYESGCR